MNHGNGANLIHEILVEPSVVSSDGDIAGKDLVDKFARLENLRREDLIVLRTRAEIENGNENTISPSVIQMG